MVCQGCRLFQDAERMCDLPGHCLNPNADLKILVTSLCLGCPVPIRWYPYFAHRVMFHTIIHYFLLFSSLH